VIDEATRVSMHRRFIRLRTTPNLRCWTLSTIHLTFHNDDNGFAVLKVKARGKRDLVPVVGHVATISAGEFIHAVGVWITDGSHGLQFKANFLKTTPPTTAEGIEKYLGSGMVRGIGPKLAERPTGLVLLRPPAGN